MTAAAATALDLAAQTKPAVLGLPAALPVSCPKPKVATPQSAIDILLALSEATAGDNANAASQLRKQTTSSGAQIQPPSSAGGATTERLGAGRPQDTQLTGGEKKAE